MRRPTETRRGGDESSLASRSSSLSAGAERFLGPAMALSGGREWQKSYRQHEALGLGLRVGVGLDWDWVESRPDRQYSDRKLNCEAGAFVLDETLDAFSTAKLRQ